MKYRVYHAKEPNFGMGEHVEFTNENFSLVAEVECESHGEVFRLTNHIDDSWWNNYDVRVIKKSRSTSVGDVVERTSDGQLFRCEGDGWTEIGRSLTVAAARELLKDDEFRKRISEAQWKS